MPYDSSGVANPKNTANVTAARRVATAAGRGGGSRTATTRSASTAGRGGGARTPAPTPIQTPAVTPDNFSDNFGGGGSIDPYSALPTTNVGADYAAAQVAALGAALKNYEADYAANKANYGLDYGEGLRKLGWSWTKAPSEAMLDEMTYVTGKGLMSGTGDTATPVDVSGQFSYEDPNTASGRAYQNQLNDFAARGMLRSTDFVNARQDLGRTLTDQFGAMQNARQRYIADLNRQLKTYQAENAAQVDAAKLAGTNSYVGGL